MVLCSSIEALAHSWKKIKLQNGWVQKQKFDTIRTIPSWIELNKKSCNLIFHYCMITIAASERPPRAKINKYHIALCIMVNLVFSCWVSKHDLILDVLDEKNELNKLTNSQFKAYSWRSWHSVTASDKKASLFSFHSVVGLSSWKKNEACMYLR